MAPKDMNKTTFTTECGIYYYTTMSFGLKNVGATDQRMAIALLHDMMHNEVEVYIDDMIVKYNDRGGHTLTWENSLKGSRSIDWDWTPKSVPLE